VLTGAMGLMAGYAYATLHSVVSGVVRGAWSAGQVDSDVHFVPFLLVGFIVWISHWRIAARDRTLVGERGGSATLRRWYIYGAAFVGLVLLVNGANSLLEVLWRMATQPAPGLVGGLDGAVSGTLVGLAVWLLHWQVLPRRNGVIALDDGTSVLRSVYLLLALSVGVIGTLAGSSQLLYYAAGRLLGIDRPGGVGGDLLQAAAGPASLAIVSGVTWAYQRHALRQQARAFHEAPRQVGLRRLYRYLVALVAVGALAIAAAGLLWTLINVVFTASAATTGDGWRGSVAFYATLAIVSLPMWLLYWRPDSTSDEAHSLSRRLYLYLTLIAAMLGLIGSGAYGLNVLLRLLLGDAWNIQVATSLADAVAYALVAAVVAAYHWRILQSDGPRQRAVAIDAPVAAEAPVATATPVAAEAPAQATIQIRAADSAALERALETLRSTGVDVAVIHGVG